MSKDSALENTWVRSGARARMKLRLLRGLELLVALGASVACSGGKPSSGDGGAGFTPISIGSTGGRSSSGGGGSSAVGGALASCSLGADDLGCAGEQFEGESIPLDVYILFDQSCSMSCPISRAGPGQCCTGATNGRIVPVRQAMDAFLHAPESSSIGFGLGYFGNMALGQTSCTPSDYAAPALPVANGQADAIVASLDQATPTGETPTGAALRGACSYARSAQRARPGRSTVILLVTDGVPETPVSQCGATLSDAVAAASECADDPTSPVKTYVLGVGQALQNLNQIAAAGHTQKAYLVDGGDVASAMLAALNTIRGDAMIPCELSIPPATSGGQLDYSQVNVGICDSTGTAKTTYYVESPNGCRPEGGWYYDDPNAPEKIVLCKASCDTVSVRGARLFYSVGCKTSVAIK
jgi:hypothetical protein